MRNIWKVKNGKTKKLLDIIGTSRRGDVILLYPGEYHLLKGLDVNEVEIKGVGNDPSDVVIHGFFSVHNGASLSLANVTIHTPHNRNGINLKDKSTVQLDKVIIHGERSGEYPAIWCERSTLKMNASEVYFSEDKD